MIGIILAVTLAQAPPTVAVTVDANQPAVVMTLADAQARFKELCTSGSDDKLLRALAAAINPLPDWPQFVMNGEPSVCNRAPKPIIPLPLINQPKDN